MMDKKTALKSLQDKISEIKNLLKGTRYSAEHTKWVSDTIYLLEDIFGRNSRIFITFASLTWTASGTYLTRGWDPQQEMEEWQHNGYLSNLDTAKGILESGIEQIKLKGIEKVYQGKDTPRESSTIVKIISLIDSKLRKLIREKPNNEKEVQDSLENLFIGAGLDTEFSREKERVVYSSKTYVPDFVFKRINTVVEVKYCTTVSREKEIISEINDDILAYKTKYANLIFVIYDLGVIRDRDQLKSSMESNEHVVIKIIKH